MGDETRDLEDDDVEDDDAVSIGDDVGIDGGGGALVVVVKVGEEAVFGEAMLDDVIVQKMGIV